MPFSNSQTDAGGNTTTRAYDALGRVIQITDALNNKTQASYNAQDQIVSLTDAAGNTHRFEYDKNGQLIKETRPMGGVTTYSYDATGQLTRKVDAAGHITTYAYDADGRLTESTQINALNANNSPATPEQTTCYTYNAAGHNTGYTQTNAAGQIISEASYTVDALGRTTEETIQYGSSAALKKTIRYTYNADGQKSSVTYPDGSTSQYSYDNTQLKTITLPHGKKVELSEYNWNQPGRITLPAGVRQLSYDGLQRLTGVQVKNNQSQPQTLMDWKYQYDVAGNITQRQTQQGSVNYQYDRLYRLTQAQPDAALQTLGLPKEQYSYDAVHNRLSSQHQPGAWQYNANNQLTQWGEGAEQRTLTYTANGHTQTETNTSNIEQREYVYDASERLIEIKNNNQSIATYQYDPQGRRISKTTAPGTAQEKTTYYLYNDQGLIAELDAQGQLTKAYGWQPESEEAGLWGTDPLWQAELTPGQSLNQASYHYLQTDHLGTPQMALNEQGEPTWQALSEAFGNARLDENNQITMNLRFPGQYFDAETGLHQNYFRDYNHRTGRYLQSDPIGLGGGVNLYTYAYADPQQSMDPEGKIAPVAIAIGVAVQYSRCVASCTAQSAAMSAITGEWDCFSTTDSAKDCAMECLNPLNWIGGGKGKGAVKAVGKKPSTPPVVRIGEDALPRNNDSRMKHIFRDKEGHLPDTPGNRKLLEDVARDPRNNLGVDSRGNRWSSYIRPDGSQVWTKSRDGVVINGVVNSTPKPFNPMTGLDADTHPNMRR